MSEQPTSKTLSDVIKEIQEVKNLLGHAPQKTTIRISEIFSESCEVLGLVDSTKISTIPRIGEWLSLRDDVIYSREPEQAELLPAVESSTVFEVVQVLNSLETHGFLVDLYVKRLGSLDVCEDSLYACIPDQTTLHSSL